MTLSPLRSALLLAALLAPILACSHAPTPADPGAAENAGVIGVAARSTTPDVGAVLRPESVDRLADGTVVTRFPRGITTAGGAVREIRVISDGDVTPGIGQLGIEVVPADAGYPTPADYRAAGRSLLHDYEAVTGRTGEAARRRLAQEFGQEAARDLKERRTTLDGSPARLASGQGAVVQSGCVSINEPRFQVNGCFERTVAQAFAGSQGRGEYLGEEFQVAGYSGRAGAKRKTYQLYGDMRHAFVPSRMYVYRWKPLAAEDDVSACATQSFSLSFNDVGWSTSANICPDGLDPRIENNADFGANFQNKWHSARGRSTSVGVAGVDNYRWEPVVPYAARGGFTLRVYIMGDTSGGAAQRSCSGTNQTCS